MLEQIVLPIPLAIIMMSKDFNIAFDKVFIFNIKRVSNRNVEIMHTLAHDKRIKQENKIIIDIIVYEEAKYEK